MPHYGRSTLIHNITFYQFQDQRHFVCFTYISHDTRAFSYRYLLHNSIVSRIKRILTASLLRSIVIMPHYGRSTLFHNTTFHQFQDQRHYVCLSSLSHYTILAKVNYFTMHNAFYQLRIIGIVTALIIIVIMPHYGKNKFF